MEAENEYSPGLCFCRPGNYGLKPENRQDHRDRHGDRAKWPGGAGVFHFSQPYQQLRPETVELTGIRDEMLTDAPGISRVIGNAELCGDLPVLGHKILFDYSFLKKAAVNEGMEFEKQGIDTLKLCRKFMPAVEKKNLSSACAYYSVDLTGAHRASHDALATHELYQRLTAAYGEAAEEDFLLNR